MQDRSCPTGKVIIATRAGLEPAASAALRHLVAAGKIAHDLYGYRCPSCRRWHLTKRSEWDGRQNVLAARAASPALQRWALTGEEPENPLDLR